MHWRSRGRESREISPISSAIAAAALAGVAVVEIQGPDNAVRLLSLRHLVLRLHPFLTISRAKDTWRFIIQERRMRNLQLRSTFRPGLFSVVSISLSRRFARCECKDKSSMALPGSPRKTQT